MNLWHEINEAIARELEKQGFDRDGDQMITPSGYGSAPIIVQLRPLTSTMYNIAVKDLPSAD